MTNHTPDELVDLEIRIFQSGDEGYPVEITLGEQQEFPRGILTADAASWTPGGDPVADGQQLFDMLFADGALRDAWAQARGQSPQRRIRLRIDPAAAKLHAWHDQGAEITYLTFRRSAQDAAADEAVLRRHGFPPGRILIRADGEDYGDVLERAVPDVLIEDDCESIGGAAQTASARLRPDLRDRIKVVCVREFGGIDHLPDELDALKQF